MGITIQDLTYLNSITLKDLPPHPDDPSRSRLEKLREEHFAAKTEFCVELPCLMLKYLKELDHKGDSPELRAGKMYHFILKNKTPVLPDDNLLGGGTTTKRVGVLIHPYTLAATIWPELETVSRRAKNPFPITPSQIKLLNEEIFPYWLDRSILELVRTEFGDLLCLDLLERIIFFVTSKVYLISHTIPNYGAVVNRGLKAIIDDAYKGENDTNDPEKKDFYRAVQLGLKGILAYAENLSRYAASCAQTEGNPDRQKELLNISQVLSRVPAGKPASFREAVNAVWLCHVALHQESVNVAISPGRLDQVLYEPFAAELASRRKSGGQAGEEAFLKEAVELVGCLWLKINDHMVPIPESSDYIFGGSGCNQAVTLGGVDSDGLDAVNDLTYVMLKATELLKLRDPNVNARYHRKINPPAYLQRLCEVNKITGATPCFHNDEAAIKALQGQKIDPRDARDYGSVGCVEPTSCGRTFGHTGAILLNLPSVLELALFQGQHRLMENEQIGRKTKAPEKMDSFREFQQAFVEQLTWLVDQATTLNDCCGKIYQKYHPFPLLSALMEGCLKNGKDVIQGGAQYNSSGVGIIGLAEVVDSLAVIEEFVFRTHAVSFAEMLGAIKRNWEGDKKFQRLRAEVKKYPDKFGSEGPMAKKIADWLIKLLHETFQSKTNYRGGKYTVGYWTMTMHAGFGALSQALPSGRRDFEPFPSGITPVSGAAPYLTDCLHFVAKLDPTHIANGQALNLKYTPGTTTIPKFSQSIEAYFKLGGLQVQFNIIDRQTFRLAQQYPEKYQDLFVRVSGYSAYFNDLNPQMQEEIITRAEYDLDTGVEVPDLAIPR
jgi:pyruvate formate-lyase/glycerol dehydratase family glycyl radical enzyme